jgi:Cu+-exporting ATPase
MVYNVIGVTVAVQGLLSPVMAAVLMPLSSVSIVLFTTVSTAILAKQKLG